MVDAVIWGLLLFLLIYDPIFGYRDFQKFKVDVQVNDRARMTFYKQTIIGLWVPTIVILLLVAFSGITLGDIGLSLPTFNFEPLGTIPSMIALGIGLLYFLFVTYFILGFHFNSKVRAELTKKKKEEWDRSVISPILPVTAEENKRWNYVSITAGLTEEVIYRGFLIFALLYLFPSLSIWIVIVLAAILFGLAHTYQGFLMGVVRTSVFGVLFCTIYISLDSLLPLIVLHFMVDYIAKLGD
ncbi:CAAX amino terminal protease self- immunity [Bhargavaea cecembensis DSE10]|uniref:CAAX amino terminal protease self-immunity n=1 Tax=Bhargavaea cecembensis DSE10 TaxID=1235279 RepID=M7NH81_9BACL|nr:CPBP family intramembrane glutamic endopeptidase [Bhargavaea cecembensis]EMR06551.1 CAAX amino terminal protease self- immunity [Bhargavaea cecembensis DSE10]